MFFAPQNNLNNIPSTKPFWRPTSTPPFTFGCFPFFSSLWTKPKSLTFPKNHFTTSASAAFVVPPRGFEPSGRSPPCRARRPPWSCRNRCRASRKRPLQGAGLVDRGGWCFGVCVFFFWLFCFGLFGVFRFVYGALRFLELVCGGLSTVSKSLILVGMDL